MRLCLRRREFIAAIGGAAAAWPMAASAQQAPIPIVALTFQDTLPHQSL